MNNIPEIKTEGIKYIGSKLKIIPYILQLIDELDVETVLDGFSGTTRVSQALSKCGYVVTCVDTSAWSQVFGNCYLKSKNPKSFYQEYLDCLNRLDGEAGWFTHSYAREFTNQKAPFQQKNLMKLDSIRKKIEEFDLDYIDKSVLLTSLILGLDKVDNTLGHFSSYLAEWSPRSYDDLVLKIPDYDICMQNHTVLRSDIFEAIRGRKFDLAYFDPPYGSNNEKMPSSRVRYASYYHFYTTVIQFDNPVLFGKVHRREDTRDSIASSVFEEFKKDSEGRYVAIEAIRRLIQGTDARYIIFSYNNGGRATKEELCDIFNSCGNLLKVVSIDYKKNVMSTMRWTNEWINSDEKNVEYLFLIEK